MATITIADIRIGFTNRIALMTDFWEAPVPEPLFGPSQVPDAIPATKAHLAFVVGVPSTPKFLGREKASVPVFAETVVRVRFMARHVAGDETSKTSHDVALHAEHRIIKQVMAQSASWPGYPIGIESVTRGLNPSGEWFLTEINFLARHPFALQ